MRSQSIEAWMSEVLPAISGTQAGTPKPAMNNSELTGQGRADATAASSSGAALTLTSSSKVITEHLVMSPAPSSEFELYKYPGFFQAKDTLNFFNKPIYFLPVADQSFAGSANTQELFMDLQQLSSCSAVIPLAMRSLLLAQFPHMPSVHTARFGGPSADCLDEDEMGQHIEELNGVVEVMYRSSRAWQTGMSDEGWQKHVHKYVFQAALENSGAMEDEDATISPDESPDETDSSGDNGGTAEPVDHTAVTELAKLHLLSPKPAYIDETMLKSHFATLLNRFSIENFTIKPDVFSPFNMPLTVLINEECDSDSQADDESKLGNWVVTWHKRWHHLLAHAPGGVMITVPIILIANDHWQVYFAVDRGTHVDVFNPGYDLGSTSSVLGTYQIIACLQRINAWIQTDFQDWVQALVS